MVDEAPGSSAAATPSPLREIRVLLPVWGQRYVSQFLELGLPSLLAPGNMPSLAGFATTTFVLQTRRIDAKTVEAHPGWTALKSACATEIDIIDDLVSDASAMVLTLAWTRAIRSRGPAITDTCFVFLVGDYVMASGSLANIVARVARGADAVLAGNFQCDAQKAGPALMAARTGAVLPMTPRELVQIGLASLHPQTTRAMPQNDHVSRGANRLFWRAGSDGLVGRFWLMHMVAIRPEVAEFTISAPSDYALVPELCPSGHVERIASSDEYCVLEVQPDAAMEDLIDATPEAIAREFESWTTKEHRDNSEQTICFGAVESPASCGPIREAAVFASAIGQAMRRPPRPSHHHPYWAGMLHHHVATARRRPDLDGLSQILGYRVSKPDPLRRALLGSGAEVRAWHPRWADIVGLRRAVRDCRGKSVLVAGNVPYSALSLFEGARSVRQADLASLADNSDAAFDMVAVFCRSSSEARCYIHDAAHWIALDGRLVLVVGDVFGSVVVAAPGALPDHDAAVALRSRKVRVALPGQIWLQALMMRLARTRQLWALIGAAILAVPSMVFNMLSLQWRGAGPIASSVSIYSVKGAADADRA